mmetsp:Transcript_18378/g.19833  ORF Transcript_18378/g.19833 Transcript_18378/m.19833 type:complete len:87 (-) Transcript_18378:505-765(-)
MKISKTRTNESPCTHGSLVANSFAIDRQKSDFSSADAVLMMSNKHKYLHHKKNNSLFDKKVFIVNNTIRLKNRSISISIRIRHQLP